jgi:hypothetical protein
MAELTEAAKEARRAYWREWNKKNKDKRAEANRRYWERKAEKLRAESGALNEIIEGDK